MARRAPADEPDYNPLGLSLVRDVLRAPRPAEEVAAARPQPVAPASETSPKVVSPEVAPGLGRGGESSPAAQEKLSYSPPVRVLLPTAERRELDQLVASLAGELGTRVKLSHLIRSCLTLLRHSEEPLLKRARKARGLVRPPNNEAIALAEFEEALTDLVGAALRETPFRKLGTQE